MLTVEINSLILFQDDSRSNKSGEKKRWIHDPSSKIYFKFSIKVHVQIVNFFLMKTTCERVFLLQLLRSFIDIIFSLSRFTRRRFRLFPTLIAFWMGKINCEYGNLGIFRKETSRYYTEIENRGTRKWEIFITVNWKISDVWWKCELYYFLLSFEYRSNSILSKWKTIFCEFAKYEDVLRKF